MPKALQESAKEVAVVSADEPTPVADSLPAPIPLDPFEAERRAWEEQRKQLVAALNEPVPDSAKRTRDGGGGKSFTYVTGAYPIRVLNRLAPLAWCDEILKLEFVKIGQNAGMYYCVASITAFGVHHQGVGRSLVRDVNNPNDHDTAVAGAATDAFKRAAIKFGEALGLSLYQDDHEPDSDKPAAKPAARGTGGGASSPAQVRAIYGIARDQHDLDEADVDDLSVKLYGATPAELTKKQASDLITYLKQDTLPDLDDYSADADAEPTCADCGAFIEPFGEYTAAQLADIRRDKYGAPLCGRCVSARKKRLAKAS